MFKQNKNPFTNDKSPLRQSNGEEMLQSNKKEEYENKGWAFDENIDPADLELSAEGQDQAKFLEEYIKSPKYLERLRKTNPNATREELIQERNTRLSNLTNPDLVKFMSDKDFDRIYNKGPAGVYATDELIEYDKKIQGISFPENIHGDSVILRPEYAENYYKSAPWRYKTIVAHELSHAVDEGGDRLSENAKKFIKDHTKQPEMEYENYYVEPTESAARVQAARYLLKEGGIYDAGTEDFTKKHLDKARTKPNIKYDRAFQDILKYSKSDEDLIKIMNTIADVSTDENDYSNYV